MELRAGATAWSRATSVVLAALLIALAPQGAAAQGNTLEYAVKAAYLSKFGNFVRWPEAAFVASAGDFVLCVAGEDPFGAALDKAAESQHVGERRIVVRRLTTVAHNSGCNILYIHNSDAQSIDQALTAVRGDGVLTVTDTAGDGGTSGIVRFVIKDNRVRFDIDDRAASQNGLSISSELLKLALSVTPRT